MILTDKKRAALGVAGLALTLVFAPAVLAKPPAHAPAHGYRDKKGATPPKSEHAKKPTHHRTAGDIDGDGIPNGRDKDMDGDGVVNTRDKDMDGDGIPNAKDRQPQVANHRDKHKKGAGTKDTFIKDMKHKIGDHRDKDAKKHARQGDIDKDGIANRKDKDLDGDGIRNKKDKDRDGDKVSNKKDEFDRRKNKK